MNYNNLDREELIFLVNEINTRNDKIKDSLKRYHSSVKGRKARLNAQSKLYEKKKALEPKLCSCGKMVNIVSMYSHIRTQKHIDAVQDTLN